MYRLPNRPVTETLEGIWVFNCAVKRLLIMKLSLPGVEPDAYINCFLHFSGSLVCNLREYRSVYNWHLSKTGFHAGWTVPAQSDDADSAVFFCSLHFFINHFLSFSSTSEKVIFTCRVRVLCRNTAGGQSIWGTKRVRMPIFFFESEQRSPLLAGCYFSPVHQESMAAGVNWPRNISSTSLCRHGQPTLFWCCWIQVDVDLREYVRSAV